MWQQHRQQQHLARQQHHERRLGDIIRHGEISSRRKRARYRLFRCASLLAALPFACVRIARASKHPAHGAIWHVNIARSIYNARQHQNRSMAAAAIMWHGFDNIVIIVLVGGA